MICINLTLLSIQIMSPNLQCKYYRLLIPNHVSDISTRESSTVWKHKQLLFHAASIHNPILSKKRRCKSQNLLFHLVMLTLVQLLASSFTVLENWPHICHSIQISHSSWVSFVKGVSIFEKSCTNLR